MQNYDDDSAERITPHALAGEEREEYLDKLWNAFTEVATAGMIALQTAHNIVEDLAIDGDERYLETHIPKEKWQSITFEDLTRYVDDMSRAASAEYQDAAEATREAKAQGALAADGATGGVAGEGDESGEGDFSNAIQRKFQTVIDILSTPKILLIASTNAVMIVVSTALIIGLATTWSSGANTWFKEHVTAIEAISSSAIESIMLDMEREQHESLEHVTMFTTAWLTMQMQTSQLQTHEAGVTQRLRRVSTNIAEVQSIAHERTYETGYLNALEEVSSRLDVATANEGDLAVILGLNTTANGTYNGIDGADAVISAAKIRSRFSNRESFRPAMCDSEAVLAVLADPLRGTRDILRIPFTNSTVCAIDTAPPKLHRACYDAVKAINAQMPVHFGYVTIFERNSTEASLKLSADTTPALGCLDESMIDYCTGITKVVDPDADMQTLRNVLFLHNNSYYISLKKIIDQRAYLGLALSAIAKKEQLQKEIIDFANIANDPSSAIAKKLAWRIDIALLNLTTGEVIPRATKPPSTAGCVFGCDVSELTRNEILNVFANGTHSSDATLTLPGTNYTPVTLTHTHSTGGLTGVPFLAYLSSPRPAEKERMFGHVIQALNWLNEEKIGEFESVVIGLEGMPPMRTFYAYEACPDDVHCITDPRGVTPANNSFGVVYRYDCRDCMRRTRLEDELGRAVILTDPRHIGRSYANEGCTSRACMEDAPSKRDSVVRHTNGRGETENYAGQHVYYVNTYLDEWGILVEAQILKSDLSGPVNALIGIASGISVVVMLLGIAVLWFFANRNFDIIEKDWAHFKKQIQREKDRFAGLVKGFIPPHIVDRMVGGHRVLVDQTQGSTFAFIDLCAFSSESKTWQPKQISRYLAYCFFVMEEVAAKYSVMKLRTIGDLFCCVAQRLERTNKDTKEDPAQHPVRRAMDMSATLMLLFSPSYEHYPQNSKNFRDIFKERHQDGRPTQMPVIRIGMHLGPAVGGAFSVGNTSHFDFFGPGPSLANRMQLTALPGRIHVTSVVREALKARDVEHCYTFDSTRRTIVRGQGTIASYFVKSVLVSAPTSLTEPMGIRPATKRVDFTVQKKRGTDSNASEQSDAGA